MPGWSATIGAIGRPWRKFATFANCARCSGVLLHVSHCLRMLMMCGLECSGCHLMAVLRVTSVVLASDSLCTSVSAIAEVAVLLQHRGKEMLDPCSKVSVVPGPPCNIRCDCGEMRVLCSDPAVGPVTGGFVPHLVSLIGIARLDVSIRGMLLNLCNMDGPWVFGGSQFPPGLLMVAICLEGPRFARWGLGGHLHGGGMVCGVVLHGIIAD